MHPGPFHHFDGDVIAGDFPDDGCGGIVGGEAGGTGGVVGCGSGVAVEDEACPDGTEDCVLESSLGEVGEDLVVWSIGCCSLVGCFFGGGG